VNADNLWPTMNLRVIDPNLEPVERLAAFTKLFTMHFKATYGREPDFADYRDAQRPILEKELLLARAKQARALSSAAMREVMTDISIKLLDVEKEIEVVMQMYRI
jgi:hypothetical protein